MNKKKLIIIGCGVFALIEFIVIITALKFTEQDTNILPDTAPLRLGIMSPINKQQSIKEWSGIAGHFEEEYGRNIEIYPANSIEELITGLKFEVLDLIVVDPVIFLKLKKNMNPHIISFVSHSLSEIPKGVTTLLVTKEKNLLICKTKGKRIMFANPYSLSEFIVPKIFMETKFNMPLEKWFSDVTFAGTNWDAILSLLNNKTDIIAVNQHIIKKILKTNYNISISDLTILWVFSGLPEPVLCARKSMKNKLIEKLKNVFNSSFGRTASFRCYEVDLAYKKRLNIITERLNEIKKLDKCYGF